MIYFVFMNSFLRYYSLIFFRYRFLAKLKIKIANLVNNKSNVKHNKVKFHINDLQSLFTLQISVCKIIYLPKYFRYFGKVKKVKIMYDLSAVNFEIRSISYYF